MPEPAHNLTTLLTTSQPGTFSPTESLGSLEGPLEPQMLSPLVSGEAHDSPLVRPGCREMELGAEGVVVMAEVEQGRGPAPRARASRLVSRGVPGSRLLSVRGPRLALGPQAWGRKGH